MPASWAAPAGPAATGETVNVFPKAAFWDNVQIALTGRALQDNERALNRFTSRGVGPGIHPAVGKGRATRIPRLCGGEGFEVVVAGAVPETCPRLTG